MKIMFKIKNNINLKEILPKYGFKHKKGNIYLTDTSYDYWEINKNFTDYAIETDNRTFYLNQEEDDYINVDLLYDMIKDGIVEKVEE